MSNPLYRFTWLAGLLIPLLACVLSPVQPTAIPVGRPPAFDVQIATPTPDPRLVTIEPTVQEDIIVVVPLGDAPTHTPDPSLPVPTATRLILVTDTPPPPTPTPLDLLSLTPTIIATEEITAVVVAPTATPVPASEPDPPLQGGDWDFESDFIPWGNPHGEPCPGARVASGWTAFVEQGPFGSSCLNENLYQPNVFSGGKSQEITFDFIAANSGVFRTIPTKVGHRYNIVAYAKHDRSLSPVEMYLGVDLTGGGVWSAETVEWFPWDSNAEDTWGATEETVTATGEQMTIFLRGVHPLAEQGGKTVVDNVSVTDLGP